MQRSLDTIAEQLASAQHGHLSMSQARRIGFSAGQIRHRIDHGRWRRVHRNVVRFPGVPDSFDGSVMAAWLDTGGRMPFARSTAAALLGLDGVPRPDLIELVVPRGGSVRHPEFVVHLTRALPPVDLISVRRTVAPKVARSLRSARIVTAYRSTSGSRTIIDLAPELSDTQLGSAIDSAARLGFSSPTYLARRLLELRKPGRRGVGRVESALVDSGGHTYLERALLTAVRKAGLAKPRSQVVWRRDGRRIGRVDFDFHPAPVVVEVNGARGHSSDADRAKDARRRNELQLIGITVLEFTYLQVTADPEGVAADIAHALTLAARSAPRGTNPAAKP